MSEWDVIAYLASKGHRGRPVSGGRELAYACFFDCAEPTNGSKKKLYVHAGTGLYDCKVCGAQGGSWLLQKHFGDEPRTDSSDDTFARRRILDSATAVGVSALQNNDDVLLYLMNERGFTPDTILNRRFGFIASGWSLTGSLPEGITAEQLKSTGLVHRDGPRAGNDFFYRHLLIPVMRHGHTLQIRGRIWGEHKGGKYMSGPGEPTRIYNLDSLDGAEEGIVCEGEFDTALLAQVLGDSPEPRLQKMAVIGLPGTQAIPEDFEDAVSGLKRIYFGLDSDEPGQRATTQLAQRIGARARALILPFENGRKCDWTEYLLPSTDHAQHPYSGHTWRDVARLLGTANGKRIFSVAEAGQAWRAYHDQHEGLRTGFTGLDATISPGLLPGQVVVVLAKTGAGKTVWLCNLAYNMRRQRVLFVSLEMTREEVYDRLRKIYLFHHPYASDRQIDDGLANVFICDENRLGSKDLSALASEFATESDGPPDVVLVDYLGYYARGFPGGSPYEKVGNAVMELKAEAKNGRFVVVSPAQVNRGAKEGKPIDLDDARDAGQVEETADFLLALFRPDDALQADGLINLNQPTGKVKLSLLKSRHGGKGTVLSLQMDLLSLAMVDDNTPAARRAMDHNYLQHRGYAWEDAHRRDSQPVQDHIDIKN